MAETHKGILRRRRTQKGQELMEFGLVFGLCITPLFVGMIVFGMSLITSNQVNALCRSIGSLYIAGTDFTTTANQSTVATLAAGLNLQVGNTGGAANTSNGGSGIVTITELMYLGSAGQPSCSGVTGCNVNKFVYIQRIRFGNSSLASAPVSVAGNPAGATIDAKGMIVNPKGDAAAVVPGTAQTAMASLWNAGATGGIQDGQTVYMVETYFESQGFNFGQGNKGVYAKFFF